MSLTYVKSPLHIFVTIIVAASNSNSNMDWATFSLLSAVSVAVEKPDT